MASTGTGVVLGSHSVKVLQARKKGGTFRLVKAANVKLDTALAERALDGQKVDRLASVVSAAMGGGGDAMLGLTGRDLIIRYTHVPPVPDWRLEMLMKFEIEEVSEQSGGGVSADWARLDLPESVSGDNTVLVALAKNQSLMPGIEVLKKGGLTLKGACPNAIAFYHAYVNTAKIQPGEVTVLMHIGAENTDIAIQRDGRLIFARNVSGGGRLFTEAIMQQFQTNYDRAEKMKFQKADVTPKSSARYDDALSEKVSNAVLGVTGQFVSMVHSSVMFCKAQAKLKDLSADRVVLAGGGANLKGFAEYLETNLGMPVQIYDPSSAVDLSGLSPKEVETFELDPTGMTVPLGLAIMSMEAAGLHVEIMPDAYRKRRSFMDRDLWMIGAGALVALLIIILFATTGRDHGSAKEEELELKTMRADANEAIANLDAARVAFEAAEKRWAELHDRVRVGPDIQRALAITKQVFAEEEFQVIHVTEVDTSREDVLRAMPGVDIPSGEDLVAGQNARKIMVVSVNFKAKIKDGQQVGRVYASFVQSLRAVAEAEPGVGVKDIPPNQRDGTFRYTLTFDPVEGE